MNTEALILMIAAKGIITVLTVYFFYKVLTVPQQPEPDSYSENDDD
jgi:hypothetical protein